MKRQRGATMLFVLTGLFAVTAAAALAALRPLARPDSAIARQQSALAMARDALSGHALRQRCNDPTRPIDTLLACPEGAAGEGIAAAACPGISRGWLPWRTLGLPPLRDASGTCLWIERSGLDVRVIAPGAPPPGQVRISDPARTICPGNDDPAQYLDPTDRALTMVLDVASLTAACP